MQQRLVSDRPLCDPFMTNSCEVKFPQDSLVGFAEAHRCSGLSWLHGCPEFFTSFRAHPLRRWSLLLHP